MKKTLDPTTAPNHPGAYVRQTVLVPRKISVTDAAKLIGISRPSVSNFLNGKVSATPDMASRIERAFGVPAAVLLEKQAEFDAATKTSSGSAAAVAAYVPPFLGILANEIVDWVDHNIRARSRLAVLLRTLVNSTAAGLEKVDFPGNDDAERPGWDGYSVATANSPWVPRGACGWEFGVNEDVRRKADSDFRKSVKNQKKSERAKTTFLFVTPRRWPGKTEWAQEMRNTKQWNDVRAYDAADLEQWVAQSPAAQAWFASEVGRPSEGVRSLDKCWADWANVATPPLSERLFDTAVEVGGDRVRAFVEGAGESPLIVAADSVEEALAFLAQVFDRDDLKAARDRVIVFDTAGVLPRLAEGTQSFIAIVHRRDVERELGPYSQRLRAIVVYPRNATNSEPDITLEPLGYEAFHKGLGAMGCSPHEVTRYENSSGRSLTVLRRQMSNVEAIRTPEWAYSKAALALVPLMLLGSWNTANESDRAALSLVASDKPFDDLEREAQELARLNDAPIWSLGTYRGVISKIDSLFATAGAVTRADLDRFLGLARIVLSEDDPALDLPEKDRWWRASWEGKRREFSSALRNSVSETLVLLAVHGRHLFKTRIGFDGEQEAAQLIRELLQPLTTRRLEASDRELPVLAEAAPSTFLELLEKDLQTPVPAVLGLLRPADTGMFGVPMVRSGLLWALEGLAWNPATFVRAVLILARLSEVEISDNWANKPIASLQTIFRSWMPQTAVGHEGRVSAMRTLIERFPAIGWEVCVAQFGQHGSDVGQYSHKPTWRTDAYGFGEPFKTTGPSHDFRREMVEIALSRPAYSAKMLSDLIERLHGLGAEYRNRVWDIIEAWMSASATEADVATVREKIRVSLLSQRARRRAKGDATWLASLTKRARAIFERMEPTDLIARYEWLFRTSYVEESADELDDDDLDYRKREERIGNLRKEAVKAVYDSHGAAGVIELIGRGQTGAQIGWYFAKESSDPSVVEELLLALLGRAQDTEVSEYKNAIAGILRAIDESAALELLSRVIVQLEEDDASRLLALAPYRQTTWELVDAQFSSLGDLYWKKVQPDFIFEPRETNSESIERLLTARRPRAAFATVHFKLDAIAPTLLFKVLSEIAKGGDDLPGQYQLREYDVKSAFGIISRSDDIAADQKASLEFAFIDILAEIYGDEKSHIPHLEKYVEAHPEMYVQALVWAYRRTDGGNDPENLKAPDGRTDLATRGFRLLEGLQRIPGHDLDGSLKSDLLLKWVTSVRDASAKLDRLDVCDINIGKLLAHSAVGADGVWPCEPVRDVIEELESEAITRGAHTGVYNSRGVHWRGEGGAQERDLAAKYQTWSDALQFTHPFVSSMLLKRLAETYSNEAHHQDTEAGIRRRMRH